MKKTLKIAGIVILAIILIPLVVALFSKKDYAVTEEVTINQPVAVVFEYVKFLKNQDEYSVWSKIDPDMKTEYRGIDGTVGFVSAWSSEVEDAGSGEQEIIAITEGERIDYEIRFFEPFESTSKAFMTTGVLSDQQTKVHWGFTGRMAYPMNLMLLLIDFEAAISNDLATGLSNLKSILESRLAEEEVPVSEEVR